MFQSPELWVEETEIDRVVEAAQGTVFEDQGSSAEVRITSSRRHHVASPDDGLCQALGFDIVASVANQPPVVSGDPQ